jgi:hypothetical protein
MLLGYDYYLCRTKTQMRLMVPGERCSARYISARALEGLVWQDPCEVLTTPEIITHAMERGGHWLPQELQAVVDQSDWPPLQKAFMGST